MGYATAVADEIRVADEVFLPIDYVTKTAAILAQRRKGKTYTAAVIAEELARLGQPWVALDPTGAWWGLRSSADGESAGLPVVVIGGQHGDLPLDVSSGAVIADLVLDHPGWYVLDLSLLEGRPAEREFATAFGARLHRRKMQPGMDFPLHLFIDEADMFVPQEKETRGDVALLAAYQGIVRRGGLHGLGTTLISQRPALVNKSVLTQLDLLILLRLVAGNDQEAVYKNYISRATTKAEAAEVMESLATLKVGEAWFFEPGAEPRLLERVSVNERRTFNSSATPKVGEARVEPKVLADVMLDDLRVRLSDAIERAEAEDPEALRRRAEHERRLRLEAEADLRSLAEWAREVEEADGGPTAIDALIAVYRAAKSRGGFSADLIDGARELADGAGRPTISDGQIESVVAALTDVEALLERVLTAIVPLQEAAGAKVAFRPPTPDALIAEDARKVERAQSRIAAETEERQRERAEREPTPEPTVPGELPTAAKSLLATIAHHHPVRLAAGQAALLSGRKARGGSWNTAVKALREGGYLHEEDGLFALTAKGVAATGAPDRPLSPEEMRDRWREALPTAAKDLYDLLVSVYPRPMSLDALASSTGRKPHGGSWNSAVATLTRNGLATKSADGLALTEGGYGR